MTMPTVQVIERGVVLYDGRAKNPLQYVVRGDVGLLPNGKLAARWPSTRRDGTAIWATSEWSENRDVRRPLPHQTDWGDQFESIRERRQDGWNVLTAALEATPLFATGRVLYPRRNVPAGNAIHPPPDVPVDWLPFVRRHAVEGDWGQNGRYKPGILDEVMLWTLSDQPVEIQNRASIAAGGGAVRSCYALDEETGKRLVDPIYPQRRAFAELLTVVSRAGNRSICYITTR